MLKMKCTICTKDFEFDPRNTPNKIKRLRLSRTGGVDAEYYPTCPHCGKKNTIEVRTGK